jgi:hypothetical protein
VRRQRVGLYKSWVANIDEGWTRWVLEQHEFPYETLTDRDIRAGNLPGRFDVIVLPHQSAEKILSGHQPYDAPPRPGPWGPVPIEYQGGIGEQGLAALKSFVQSGGTLVALDDATELVLSRFGGPFINITDVTRTLGKSAFYCPGSIVRVSVDIRHPIGWGMESAAAANFQSSRMFATTDPLVRSVVRYGSAGRMLVSGWLLGEQHMAGRSAVLDVPFGAGRVVLIGFRPHFRAQSHATFKLLFNAISHQSSVVSSQSVTTDE